MQGDFQPHPADRQRIAGPGAAALKYDVLTAVLATAAQGDPVESRLALRLSLLITARFNWRAGTFSVGLREMARMWGVTERTAKREIAAMRNRGWIAISTPAARGRVATYLIDLPILLCATMPNWEAVGPDFVARMVGAPEPEVPSNVVPLTTRQNSLPETDETGWAEAAAVLRAQDPTIYEAWFAPLQSLEIEGGVISLASPSRFFADYVLTHYKTRLLAALLAVNCSVRDIHIGIATV